LRNNGHSVWYVAEMSPSVSDDEVLQLANKGNAPLISELGTTLERISKFQAQVRHIRELETRPDNYHASVSGFLCELDRMNLEVWEYLSAHPKELAQTG